MIACTPSLNFAREWQPTPVLLPGKSHGQRSQVGYSLWGLEELGMTERLHFHFALSGGSTLYVHNAFSTVRILTVLDFPGGSDGKACVYNAGDLGSIPGSGRSAGEGNGNPLQCYCLENPMDRGAL